MMTGTLVRPERPYISVDAFEFAPEVDLIAVERAVNGERPDRMTRLEKACAARVLDTHGFLDNQIATLIGAGLPAVRRWRVNGWNPAGKLPAPVVRREPQGCGTPAAYKRHHARGETPCDACKGANAAADRRRGMGPVGVALSVLALLPVLACMPGPVEDDRDEISKRVADANKRSENGGGR